LAILETLDLREEERQERLKELLAELDLMGLAKITPTPSPEEKEGE